MSLAFASPWAPVLWPPATRAWRHEPRDTVLASMLGAAEDDATHGEDPGERTDADLVAAAQRGDDRAFSALVRRHATRVTRLASRFTRSRADLEEIGQDVFLEVHRCLGRFDGRAPFEHWLARIATRRCYDHLRRVYRRRWFTSLEALVTGGFQPDDDGPAPGEATEDPRLAALRSALSRLPPDQRTVLTLLELEEHSVREVASLTGWSEGNVKVRAHRARAALKQALARTQPVS